MAFYSTSLPWNVWNNDDESPYLGFCIALCLAATAGVRGALALFLVSLFLCLDDFDNQDDRMLNRNYFFFNFIGTPMFTVLAGVFAFVEIVVDKVPMLDHALHSVLLVAAPCAALLLCFPAEGPLIVRGFLVAVAVILAFSIQVTRAGVRGVTTVVSAGFGNCCVSLVEDVVAFSVILTLLFSPQVAVFVLVFVLILFCIALTIVCRHKEGRSPHAGYDRMPAPVPPPQAHPLYAPQTFPGYAPQPHPGYAPQPYPACAQSAHPGFPPPPHVLPEQAVYYAPTAPTAPHPP